MYQNPGSQWSWNASSVGATLTYTLPKNAFSKFSFQGNPHCGLAKYRVTIKLGGAIIHNQEYSGATRNEIAIAYFPSQAHKDLKLKEIIDSIAAKTEELNQTLSAINAILDNASLELETSKENLAQKEQELTQKQEELAQKEAENEAVLKEIESLKAQESELQEQIKQLEEQIAQAGSADNEELESLKQSIAELEATKIQKEQELQNANANLESLKAKKAELESQIAELESQAQELQEQINLHNQEIPKLETRKHYAELKIPENEALLEQKKQEYKELAEYINTNTPADAVFMTATNHNNAVAMLTGRSIVCGSPSFLYYHGLDYSTRELDLPEGRELLHKWGVEGDWEGVGYCILGYPDGEAPAPAVRKEGYVKIIK